jgi:hypothetical protein
MSFTLASLGSAYHDAFVETGKEAELFFLVTFLLTFGFIRLSTHMIRANVSWWPGNVQVGGTHVHHLVFGIITILIIGYVGIAIAPDSPVREVLAVLFGIGAALTMDEFALWLNLRDVYWSKEGRKSIDAVIITAVVAGLVVMGVRIWLDLAHGFEDTVAALVGTFGAFNLILAMVNVAKEKFVTAVVGLFISPVSLVGAFRLAKPHSPWARVFYHDKKLARARARHERHEHRLERFRRRKPQSVAGSG